MSENRVEEVMACFQNGMACSEAIFSVYGQDSGVDRDMLVKIASVFAGGIKNTGNVNINPINVQMNFYGGFILLGRSFTETYDIQLKPGQTLNFNIYPILGLGHAQCTLSVSTTDVLPTIKTVSAYIFLFYIYISPGM